MKDFPSIGKTIVLPFSDASGDVLGSPPLRTIICTLLATEQDRSGGLYICRVYMLRDAGRIRITQTLDDPGPQGDSVSYLHAISRSPWDPFRKDSDLVLHL